MDKSIQEIKISDLVNYYENPRHAIGSSEEDTLYKLFNAVGIQYMLNLAEDIQKIGLLRHQHVVVVYSDITNKYVVYEGNRRVAAIKLLLNPEWFSFLDKATIEKAKKISQLSNVPDVVSCYITDEEEAFLIMERVHSGEDKGRGIKQWTSREKEVFKVRQNHAKNLSYLIDFFVKKYFDGLDITTILPFTTIQRIFNNREVKKQIGLDVSSEDTFTVSRMQLIINASKWIASLAQTTGIAVTRLFNKASSIKDEILPWIHQYMQKNNMSNISDTEQNSSENRVNRIDYSDKIDIQNNASSTKNADDSRDTDNSISNNTDNSTEKTSNDSKANSGSQRNLPYFFQGLNYSSLDPNDADTHGVAAVCRELHLFSDRRLVATYPISATFLIRAVIEQSLIYYSKKHNIQGQNKLIWENIKDITKLNKIIENFNRNLPNYITETTIRQYFSCLFDNYESNLDPLNWVIHRPTEFQLDVNTLVELPRKGLLALINYLLS